MSGPYIKPNRTISLKSDSSTDKSITNESDSENDESKDKLCGKCLLNIKAKKL
jgi:hypothetical protein